ncbi:MAG: hypothetical protein ACSLE6_19910 [Mycobacterium sp.]
MAYLKPPWFTAVVFNKIAMAAGISGSETGSVSYRAAEVPVHQREPVLEAYRAKAGITVEGYFRKLPAAADHPVFTLTPV